MFVERRGIIVVHDNPLQDMAVMGQIRLVIKDGEIAYTAEVTGGR